MKTPDELLIDAQAIMEKLIKLQSVIEELGLYHDIQWLGNTGNAMNQEPFKLESTLLSSLSSFLEANLAMAEIKARASSYLQ